MMNIQPHVDTQTFVFDGQEVEFWENSEVPFGSGEDDMHDYALNGQWVLLWNALLLNALPYEP